MKVSDTLGQQRRIAESRRPFDAAATQIGDWEGAAMDQLVTGEAPEAAPSRLLAEVLRQRAAISEVLRAIANSPHDLQPSPYSTPSSTAQCICAALTAVPSALSRKQAFVSLGINSTQC